MDQGTELGGIRRDFPSTCWSRFTGDLRQDGAARRSAIGELSRHYWKPIYAFIRSKWARSNEDAKDLTQDFFVWMMEGDFIGRADPQRGRFRAFVKVALQHYLSDDESRRRRQKRGGDREIFTFGAVPGDADAGLPNPRTRTPEEALDETWKSGLLLRAEAALEETLRREDREVAFLVFRDYYLSGTEELVYRDVAAKHGIAESDVLNHLKQAKKRFRSILSEMVAETVGSPSELADEMKLLFGKDPG